MPYITFDRSKDKVEDLRCYVPDYIAEAIEAVRGGRVPQFLGAEIVYNTPNDSRGSSTMFAIRSEFTKRCMWAAVDLTWTERLAAWLGDRTVLEIMAGRGWLSKALTHHGVQITATDDHSWDTSRSSVFEVHTYSAQEAVKKFDAEVLVVSWPPYHSDDEALLPPVLDIWGTDKPIVYIGEGESGCTATDEFFKHMEWDDVDIPMPHHEMTYDKLQIGRWTRDV